MEIHKLKLANDISNKLISINNLLEHINKFNKNNNKESIKQEVYELLHNYNNLMFNFDREEIAKIMYKAVEEHYKKEKEILTKQFEEL
jgi:ABC-type transporter lipoprotein component MlaA